MKNGHKITTQKNILYTILPVTLISITYRKTKKSWLKYEIKYVCM